MSLYKILNITINGHSFSSSYKKVLFAVLCFPITASWFCCTSFVKVEPPQTELINETVFMADETAMSAIRGVYNRMVNDQGFGDGGYFSVTALCALSADEFVNHSFQLELIGFNNNQLIAENTIVNNNLWGPIYKYIYYANAIMEGLNGSTKLTNVTKSQLLGEAAFIRAFCHFYLVNLFGDIPLITTTNYEANAIVSRTPKERIYEQIISDLLTAKELLPIDYSAYANERVRPIRLTASALLARVYLFIQDWENADRESTTVINSPIYNLSDNLDEVFLMNSEEAIWQLMPVIPGWNTKEGRNFILTSQPTYYSLAQSLIDGFEKRDQRRSQWIDSIEIADSKFYFPFKYKVGAVSAPLTEYSMVFRLAEQYLIRAEARLRQNDLTGSINDVNRIRRRAGLPDANFESEEDLINLVEQERRIELFSEWGHRWLDLKRSGRADVVLSGYKPQWQSTAVLYPIPQTEIGNNPNLTQNQGY